MYKNEHKHRQVMVFDVAPTEDGGWVHGEPRLEDLYDWHDYLRDRREYLRALKDNDQPVRDYPLRDRLHDRLLRFVYLCRDLADSIRASKSLVWFIRDLPRVWAIFSFDE